MASNTELDRGVVNKTYWGGWVVSIAMGLSIGLIFLALGVGLAAGILNGLLRLFKVL